MTPEMAWYPLRVTYSREMKFKAYLDALGIENFIPLHYVQPEGSGAKRKLVPVVHNLIFVRAAQATVQSLKRTSPFADQIRYIMSLTERRPLTIPPKQMRDFIAVAGTYEEQLLYLPVEEARLQAGDRVRITGGIWAGVEGHLLRVKGDCRVVVEIRGFMAVATAALHPSLVEKIPDKQ